MSSFNKVTLLLALHFVSYTSVNNASLMNPKVHVNIFNKTLFYCSFKWSGQIHRFDIYDGLRDGCQECKWSILQDGPCLAETHFSPGACYKYR
ncbi:hypothetical protein CISIN_1g038207mg [Citrus sinensis]|uniref:S-protein homolog n=1 Tax=Citrus sinensis TaxID=2711 RepID=A0A067E4Z0_CITSI|nr:hypothetical protein CISIN_1g038207mg [Citrus sinensis]